MAARRRRGAARRRQQRQRRLRLPRRRPADPAGGLRPRRCGGGVGRRAGRPTATWPASAGGGSTSPPPSSPTTCSTSSARSTPSAGSPVIASGTSSRTARCITPPSRTRGRRPPWCGRCRSTTRRCRSSACRGRRCCGPPRRPGCAGSPRASSTGGTPPQGQLVPRSLPGALVTDEDEVVERAVRMATTGRVLAVDGTELHLPVRSLCVHGDTPGAVRLARRVAAALEHEGLPPTAFATSRARRARGRRPPRRPSAAACRPRWPGRGRAESSRASWTLTTETVENVVKPPQKPVPTTTRQASGAPASSTDPVSSPSSRLPATLMARVPYGNGAATRLVATPSRTTRATAPSAPASPTAATRARLTRRPGVVAARRPLRAGRRRPRPGRRSGWPARTRAPARPARPGRAAPSRWPAPSTW